MGGQTPFKCSFCDASFTKSGNLKKHVEAVHDGQKFKCSICDASFTHSGSLKKHVEAVHEGKKPFKSSPFKCLFCNIGSSFTQKAQLINHISTLHDGKNSFKCSECNSSFSLSKTL